MPKRTNDFQQLVALVEEAFAPAGAKVTESAEITDFEGRLREIDVLIESENATFKLRIAVEAKDERRPMDITKFESIVGKYSKGSGLAVDKAVVVSASGFSKRVVSRASREGIELLTYERALAADWAAKIPQKLVYRCPPYICSIGVSPTPSDTSKLEHYIRHGQLKCSKCNRNHGNPFDLLTKAIHSPDFRDQIRSYSRRQNGEIEAAILCEFGNNVSLYCDNEVIALQALEARIKCTEARSNLSVTAYSRQEELLHHFKGDLGTHRVQFVVVAGDGCKSDTWRIDPLRKIEDLPTIEPKACELPELFSTLPSPELDAKMSQLASHFMQVHVRIQPDVTLYHLDDGYDFRVRYVIDFWFSKLVRYRTAILAALASTRTDDWANWAKGALTGLELDRLIVIGGNVQSRLSNIGRIVHLGQIEELDVTTLFPPVSAWSYQARQIKLKIMGSHSKRFDPMNPELILPQGRRLSMSQIAQMAEQEARTNTLATLAPSWPPEKSYSADVASEFVIPLPLGSSLVDGNHCFEALGIRGSVSIRAFLSVCSGGQVITNKDGTCVYFPADEPGFFAVGGGSLPAVEACGPLSNVDEGKVVKLRANAIPIDRWRRYFGSIQSGMPASTKGIIEATFGDRRWHFQTFHAYLDRENQF